MMEEEGEHGRYYGDSDSISGGRSITMELVLERLDLNQARDASCRCRRLRLSSPAL